jgi:thiosulfate reductase cytochrome b subunit
MAGMAGSLGVVFPRKAYIALCPTLIVAMRVPGVRPFIRRRLDGVIVMMMKQGQRIYRYALATRASHWLWAIAFAALVSSGLQIFNAAPFLDASDTTNPAHRVLAIDSPADGVGTTTIFGHTFTTTGWLGYTDDGAGGRSARAFPGWITIPAYQALADGRRWHLFFAWVALVCGLAWLISSAIKGNLREMILRPSDIPKLWPMQAYYLRLREEPPLHGTYNPLQKAAYTFVMLVLAPVIVLTGLALSPGIDAVAHPLTWIFGGRQFARLWHFAAMLALIGFFVIHTFQVLTQGVLNQMNAMVTGWYRLGKHDGVGP